MAEIEPPSFSLGLEFDLLDSDSGPIPPTGDGDAFVEDSDPDDDQGFHAPTLRRLRRGNGNRGVGGRDSVKVACKNGNDDDIEEFSEEEEELDCVVTDELAGIRQHSVCSSSKVSLRGCGVLTRPAKAGTFSGKQKQCSSNYVPLDSSRKKVKFSESTTSPVRRFQLLDSDSDDPSDILEIHRNSNSTDFSKQTLCGNSRFSARESSAHEMQTREPWEQFHPEAPVPTPALDSFCENYFKNDRGKNAASDSVHGSCSSKLKWTNGENGKGKQMDSGHIIPPAHHYFFHEDPGIRELVRHRLPHFFPLTAVNNTGFQQQEESVIDYRSQFSHGNGSKQQSGAKVPPKSSGKTRKGSKKSTVENPSGNWVDPRQQSIPNDAGRRRIHADSQRPGHWYTEENGRKVYVSNNGQQLTGKIAYAQYRKDTGAGFRRSRKKASTKKAR